MSRLVEPPYLSFPLRISPAGPATSDRVQHVREQIEQVLFTEPRERVFREEFGAGVRGLLFEGNSSRLWNVAHQRLVASLTEALRGEVDPQSLEVDVGGDENVLRILVTYKLAAIDQLRREEFSVDRGIGG